jgi:hypothetical protein
MNFFSIEPKDERDPSLINFLIFMSVFSAICFINSIIKLYLTCTTTQTHQVNIFDQLRQGYSNRDFWRDFAVDFLTFELPIIFYVTFFGFTTLSYVVLLIVFLIIFKIVTKRRKIAYFLSDNSTKTNTDNNTQKSNSTGLNAIIDEKIIRLSINSFRALLFIITSVCILAVDFKIFPRKHAKTSEFGFSLMDVGVGYFILCHSMRLIRNCDDDNSVSSFKK